MRLTRQLLALSAVSFTLGCEVLTAPPTAPDGAEPMRLTSSWRARVSGEQVPRVEMTTEGGSVKVRVIRFLPPCMIASATISREPQDVSVIARFGFDPSAACASDRIDRRHVFVYEGSVEGLTGGLYIVQLFEGLGNRASIRIARGQVRVR
jgi:hypothetical protein